MPQRGPAGASLGRAWLPPRKQWTVEHMSEKQKKHKLVIIVGSVREGRFGPVVASWVAEEARVHGGFDVEVVDLADIEIPLSLPAASPKFAGDSYPRPEAMATLTSRLEEAEAF